MRALVKRLVLLPLAILDALAGLYCRALAALRPTLAYAWSEAQAERNRRLTRTAVHRSGAGRTVSLVIHAPNWLCRDRAETFSTKEPETLEWIDRYGGAGAFYDIGANVGLYSMYYAASHEGPVYAFEPSFFNLGLLAKNIHANGLQERVSIVANPLTETGRFSDFSLTTTLEGGALSAFGVDHGCDGKAIRKALSYRTLGFSLDFLRASGLLAQPPRMIKLDVDGIEHLILAGAEETLKLPECRTVLIEVSEDFREQAEAVNRILTRCGFALAERRQSEMIAAGEFSHAFNQIWVKGPSAS